MDENRQTLPAPGSKIVVSAGKVERKLTRPRIRRLGEDDRIDQYACPQLGGGDRDILFRQAIRQEINSTVALSDIKSTNELPIGDDKCDRIWSGPGRMQAWRSSMMLRWADS